MRANEIRQELPERIQHYENPSNWKQLQGAQLREALCEGLVTYGLSNDEVLIQPMSELYLLAMERLPASTRLKCKGELEHLIHNGHTGPNALTPFIYKETFAPIVASTALDLSYYWATVADPLAGVRVLVEHAEKRRMPNIGAVFGGLVALGDARVNRELLRLRKELDTHELRVATQSGTTNRPAVATLEFWLDWLEDLDGSKEDSVFGLCASALGLLLRKTQLPVFSDLSRNLSCYAASAGEPIMVRATIPLSDIGHRYADRLYALEAREAPPRVMSEVLKAYGLTPKSPESERYQPPMPTDISEAPDFSYESSAAQYHAKLVGSALDRVEAALKAFGHSPTRNGPELSLNSHLGTVTISATRYTHDSRASCMRRIDGSILTVRTSLNPALGRVLAPILPVFNRFATLGSMIQTDEGPVVVSRASLLDQFDVHDHAPLLIAAAAIYGGDPFCHAGVSALAGEDSESASPPEQSEWGRGDFEAIKLEIEKSPEFDCHLDDDELIVGFAVDPDTAKEAWAAIPAILCIVWNAPHPVCGAGLHIGLELAVDVTDRLQLAKLIDYLNRFEAQPEHSSPHLGAWCPGRYDGSLCYVTFLPNVLKPLQEEKRFVNTALSRARLTVSLLAQSDLLPPPSSRH